MGIFHCEIQKIFQFKTTAVSVKGWVEIRRGILLKLFSY
jgi:hypothetical protein